MTSGTELPTGFDAFVTARAKAVWRAAWLLTGDHHRAEDLVQTALAKAHPHFVRLGDDEAFEAYLRTPEVSTWAESARRRSLRTRGMITGGALLAVAVVGALAIGNLRPGGTVGIPAAPASSTPVASPAPASTPPADGCDPGAPLPEAPQQLPSGAIDVQLCPDGYDPELTFVTPADRLTEGITNIVDAINASAPQPLSASCSAGFARTFRAVIGYRDGNRITLIGRLASSEGLDGTRTGSCDRLGRTPGDPANCSGACVRPGCTSEPTAGPASPSRARTVR